MPKKFTHSHSSVQAVHGSRFTVHGKKSKCGFSLLELLVVAGLFALTATVITVGYNGFSRRQLLTNAVNGLKNDLRFAQNQATSGVKDAGACNSANSILKGWYVEVNLVASSVASPKNNTYNIKSSCVNLYISGPAITTPCTGAFTYLTNHECDVLYKTVTLPDNVEFSVSSLTPPISEYIFFEPLKSEPTFFTYASSISSFYTQTSLNADARNAKFDVALTQVSSMNFSLFELSDPSSINRVKVSASGGIQLNPTPAPTPTPTP